MLNGEECFYIADSESSSIRAIYASDKKAISIVGASVNEKDLFSFGDVDGCGFNAKLQHPLGVHYCAHTKTLYVTDSFNHKIKKVRPSK